MMPVKHQVCSHALATRLAALGVRQESVLWWVDRKVTYTGGRASRATAWYRRLHRGWLGEMLPDEVVIPAKNGTPQTHWLRFGRYRGAGRRFWCAYPGGTARTTLEERAHTGSRRPRATLHLLVGTSAALPDGTPFLRQAVEVVMLHTTVEARTAEGSPGLLWGRSLTMPPGQRGTHLAGAGWPADRQSFSTTSAWRTGLRSRWVWPRPEVSSITLSGSHGALMRRFGFLIQHYRKAMAIMCTAPDRSQA